MEIDYRIANSGVGAFVIIDMVALVLEKSLFENKVYLTFADNIPSYYKDAKPFVEKAIKRYENLILNKFMASNINVVVQNIITHPAHYSLEAFYGATVVWIKEYFNLEIENPRYFWDMSSKKVVFGN